MYSRVFAVASIAAFLTAPAGAKTYFGIAKDPAVIWVSQAPSAAPATAVPEASMHQNGKAFVPDLLVIQAGTTVRFANDDNFFHSVYSASGTNAFDLGLYDQGPGKSMTFLDPGVVDVRCHVHGSMHATIVIVDGPFTQTHTKNERFRLDGLTPGRKLLHIWTQSGEVSTATIAVR